MKTQFIHTQLANLPLKKSTLMALCMSSILALSACSSTTNSGEIGVQRKQLLLMSSEQVLQLSDKSYQEDLAEARKKGVLDTNPAQLARLKRIADRLIAQVGVYRPDAKSWNWEVHTIKSNDLNAFVMPGGKVMFYTGIVDRLQLTDDEIAAIMGHEMAHALREHARERMSREMATQTSIGIAASLLGLSNGQTQLAGMAGNLGLSLPHSRTQESEADVMGLELMARAGYNPEAAISLWQKMQQASSGSPPQFLSTHPSSSNRIEQLRSLLPKVMPLYQAAKK